MVQKDLVDRFNAKWCKDPSGCWRWTASTAGGGYGQIKRPGERRQIYAHRLSYLIHRGEIPDGMEVCHTCDNPGCVNPDHLFLGTSKDNHQDMKEKGRHLYGERNKCAKITEAEARRVVELLGEKFSQISIAAAMGISQIQVSRIKRGLLWAHVNPNPQPSSAKRKHLSASEKAQISAMISSGVSTANIAKLIGCNKVTVLRIKRGRR